MAYAANPSPLPISRPRCASSTSAVLTNDRPPVKKALSRTEIRPPPSPSLASSLTNALDAVINNFIDPAAHRPTVDPGRVLADNWAPVRELSPTPCRLVYGEIPPSLRGGVYIRNGPNPQHLPRGTHHLFDGDGMLHSLLLPKTATSPATLSSRFVQTYKYLVEREAGHNVLPSFFAGFHGLAGLARGAAAVARIITGQLNPALGWGLANTALVFFGGRLFALGESDLPYAVHVSPKSGDITTLGRCDFDGKLALGMTAHPKKDPITGEVFAFRYGPVPPFLTYFRFEEDGRKASADVPIFSLTRPSFLHDFAITENFSIFCDIQIVMQPMEMILRGGSPVGADAGKVSRIGILPRYADSEAAIRWFDAPGFNPIHTINAWEEEEEEGEKVIVLIASNVLSVEHALEKMELAHSSVEMVRIHMSSGVVSRTPLSAWNLDFGVINPKRQGRKNRYAYLGVLGESSPKVAGIVKLDMEKRIEGGGDCTAAARMFGKGMFAGEPIFVPALDEGDEEDDGYLVTFVHDEGTRESSFVVMDARSPKLEVVAEIALPSRVPYGFHGTFLSADELKAQKSVKEKP